MKIGGVQKRTPFRAPYELVHVARQAGEVLRVEFPAGSRPTRFGFPNTQSDNSGRDWNRMRCRTNGGPWLRPNGSGFAANNKVGMLGFLSGGASVRFTRPLDYGTQSGLNGAFNGLYTGVGYSTAIDLVAHTLTFDVVIDNDGAATRLQVGAAVADRMSNFVVQYKDISGDGLFHTFIDYASSTVAQPKRVDGSLGEAAVYTQGTRTQVKSERAATAGWVAGDATYSTNYGVEQRIAVGLTLEADDGDAVNPNGPDEIYLRFIYTFDDSGDPAGYYGQAIYDFDNSVSDAWGLQKWRIDMPWCVAFDTSPLRRVWTFGFSKRPLFVKVCQGPDYSIYWIEFTLPAGTVIYAGEIAYTNQSKDSDGDNIPNFLDGMTPTAERNPVVVYEDADPGWGVYNNTAGNCLGTLSSDVVKVASGTVSKKIAVTVPGGGNFRYVGAQLDYGAGATKDWSFKHYIWAWLYGNNTGLSYTVEIHSTLDTAKYTQTYTDNWTGWVLKKIAIAGMTATGNPNMAAIRYLRVRIDTGAAYAGAAFDWYFDRIVVIDSEPTGIPYLMKGIPTW